MRLTIALCVSLVCGAAVVCAQDNGVPQPTPPLLPYVDRGACPFEGCQYAVWTARKAAVVYDTWKAGRKAIGRIANGDKVTGITGVMITYRPGVIRVMSDFPQEGLHRGDTVLTYTHHGEGTAIVWARGRFYQDFDISFAAGPDDTGCRGKSCAGKFVTLGHKVWWAKVKLANGRTGWIDMSEAEFDGVDALG